MISCWLSKLSDVVNNDVVKKDGYNTNKSLRWKNRRCRKITDLSKLVTNSALNAKIGEVENQITYHDIYITIQDFDKLTSENSTTISSALAWI